tara:strand:- start:243 stop:1820 length:1578 start_codon:yes stop_codon:yes gene_type:complete
VATTIDYKPPAVVATAQVVEAARAQTSFKAYCAFSMGDDERILYEPCPAEHHELIIRKLEAVERGEIKRLMLFMPPGSAKSTYSSVAFPPWFLGRNPRKNIIGGSHTSDLAEEFGQRARDIVSTPAYRTIFGFGLSVYTKRILRWAIEKPEEKKAASGGEYRGVGVGGGVTGRRADGLLIDDPVKGAEDADSITMRDKAWRWYTNDMRTRLKPGGWIVIIMTRWSEDDLAGRILPHTYSGESGQIVGRNGELWDVVSMPYEAKANDILGRQEGSKLWPEYFIPEEIASIAIDLGPRAYSALYQQSPTPEKGLYFHREWIQFYENRPRNLRYYAASDYAVTPGGGDYTVHGIFGVDYEDNIYVVDWWREQASSMDWCEAFCDLAEKWEPIGWAEEKGQIEKGVGPFLTKMMQERKPPLFTARFGFSSSSDKSTRAQAIRGRVQQGRILFPRTADWMPTLIAEMMTFPAGVNDDQVDVLSLIGRVLPQLQGGRPDITTSTEINPPTWNEMISDHDLKFGFGEESRKI